MNWQVDCLAVIPCLNEEIAIGSVIQSVKKHLTTVLVINDGSTDRTAAVAAKAGAIVISNYRNSGKGAALNRGWSWALEQGFKWSISLDGDGQHLAEDIPAFFSAAEKTSAALIAGNRMGRAGNMPWVRRQVNRWMSRRISAAAGKFLPDTQCGFRLMNLAAWSKIPMTTSRFEVESEVLMNFLEAGLLVVFVPIQVIYKNEKSKIHPLQDAIRWFRWWKRASKQRSVN